jgi:hypothetical protein
MLGVAVGYLLSCWVRGHWSHSFLLTFLPAWVIVASLVAWYQFPARPDRRVRR